MLLLFKEANMCVLVVLCSFSKNEKDVMFAIVAHCQIKNNNAFIWFCSKYLSFQSILLPFYSCIWFDGGSTVVNTQWGSHTTPPGRRETEPFFWYPQRLLPIDGANDLFYQPPPSLPTSKIYTIRPYFPKDEVRPPFLLEFLQIFTSI